MINRENNRYLQPLTALHNGPQLLFPVKTLQQTSDILAYSSPRSLSPISIKIPAADQLKAPHYWVFIQFSNLLAVRVRIIFFMVHWVKVLTELVEVNQPSSLNLLSSNFPVQILQAGLKIYPLTRNKTACQTSLKLKRLFKADVEAW